MVNRSLNVENDPFRPCEENEETLGPELPYMSAIGGLMYQANCTRPDIAFATNLLARYNSSPTRRHWNGIKHIFRYLQGTIDLGLYYPRNSEFGLVGFADAGYLSDPHKSRSQTGYVFTIGGTAILWRSQKQTLVATSSNHAEIIALHEACRECVWLRSMTNHIQKASGLVISKEPTKLYEDNAACVAQIKEGYIKSNRTKHILPRFFSYTQELEKNKEVDIQYIRSSDNAAYLFTKALPTSTFRKHVQNIGMPDLDSDQKSSTSEQVLRNFFISRNSSTDSLTETGAYSGNSSSSSLRWLLGGQTALLRKVLESSLTNSLHFRVNALSLEALVFIGKEGWRMVDTCRASGDTCRRLLYLHQIAPNKWRSIPYARHIRRDTCRNTPILVTLIATNGDGLRPSSNRLRQIAVNSNPRQIGSPDWRRASTLVKP
ncbi:hypothetical protein ISN44_As13g009830 [Arabidopsis suecica]|uniref:Uncharacterized protein n=1 Tax=Arabidopsis suecica TaxID=45249 RepID=A0A8T1XQA0_ARASU|nr:hypothetical protein ISN44_As13g009830 [Arabidopsis suecica]